MANRYTKILMIFFVIFYVTSACGDMCKFVNAEMVPFHPSLLVLTSTLL